MAVSILGIRIWGLPPRISAAGDQDQPLLGAADVLRPSTIIVMAYRVEILHTGLSAIPIDRPNMDASKFTVFRCDNVAEIHNALNLALAEPRYVRFVLRVERIDPIEDARRTQAIKDVAQIIRPALPADRKD
jgi:hypothetical protein